MALLVWSSSNKKDNSYNHFFTKLTSCIAFQRNVLRGTLIFHAISFNSMISFRKLKSQNEMQPLAKYIKIMHTPGELTGELK